MNKFDYKKILEYLNKKYFDVIVFLTPILVIIITYRKVIFSNAIFSHLDVLDNYFPYFNALFQSNGSMQFGILGGFPIHLSISTTWYSPISILLKHLANSFDAFRFLDITFILCAYLFTYLLCRKLSISHISSALAGLVYVFSGQVMLWSETIIISVYYGLLPLVFLILIYSFSYKDIRRIILFLLAGILLGFSWLVGHVQWAIFTHMAVFAFICYQVFKGHDSVKGKILKVFLYSLLVFAVSFIVGLPMIKAISNFAPFTARAGGVSLLMASYYSYYPYHLIHYILPSFSVPYFSFFAKAFPNYMGILPFVLIIFGLYNFKKIIRSYPDSRLFLFIGLFCLATSISYSPLIFIFHYLPFLNAIREAPRIMFVGDFVFAIYIAYILDYMARFRDEIEMKISKWAVFIKRFILWVVLPVISVSSIIYIFFLNRIELFFRNYFLNHVFGNTVGNFSKEYYFNLIHGYLIQAIGQFSISDLGIITLLIGLITTYWLFSRFNVLSEKQFKTLVVLFVSINFLFQYFNYINTISKEDYFSVPNTVKFIKEKESANTMSPFRVFSPLNGISIYTESIRCSFPMTDHWEVSKEDFMMRKELFEPNSSLVYGIDSADGYEPYMWTRTDDVIGFIGSRFSGGDRYGLQFSSKNISAEEKMKEFIDRKNFLRSMNIKYVASYYKIEDSDFKKVFEEKLGDCQTPIYLYELSNPWPRYFLANKVFFLSGKNDGEVFSQYVDGIAKNSEPRIFIEEKDMPTDNTVKISNTNKINVVQAQVGKDSLRFDVSTDNIWYLLIGNTWYPGWYATIDGKEVKILIANYSNMAIVVPKGQHVVKLEYKK